MGRRAVVLVGHHGYRTGAWWRDRYGDLDEHVLAARTAASVAYHLCERGWDVRLAANVAAQRDSLFLKAHVLDEARADLAIECHYGSNGKEGERGTRWAGVDASVFVGGMVPDESRYATGVNVVYLKLSDDQRALARCLVKHVNAQTGLGIANDNGLDPRPLTGTTSIYLTHRVEPPFRPRRFHQDTWAGCPVVLLETCSLTSPSDREHIREDPMFFTAVGYGAAAACDEFMDAQEADE